MAVAGALLLEPDTEMKRGKVFLRAAMCFLKESSVVCLGQAQGTRHKVHLYKFVAHRPMHAGRITAVGWGEEVPK